MAPRLSATLVVVALGALALSCGEEREYAPPEGWTQVYFMQAEIQSGGITDLWFNGPNDGWACVDDKVLRYDGSDWRAAHNLRRVFPSEAFFFHTISAVRPDNIWVSEGWGWADTLYHFDGHTWEEIAGPSPYQRLGDIYFPSADRGWVATDDGVFVYADGGWTLRVPGYARDLCFIDENEGWACVSTYIYHWNGSAWTPWEAREMDGGGFYDISFASPDLGWAVGYGYIEVEEEREYFPLFYRYDGVSWEKVNWPDSYQGIEKCGVAADGTGWVLNYAPYYSTELFLFDGTRIIDQTRLGREEVVNEIRVMPGGDTWACSTSDDTTITRIWHCPRAW